MRRSKKIAEKIGLNTDWNCAISLRDLEGTSKHDPFRIISKYADWDVQAQMPHGIAAIRKHLYEVDNVPLLVSLFTDATPETVTEMVRIFRGFGETVLTIGSAFRCSNHSVFNEADVSISISMRPGSDAQVPLLSRMVTDKFPVKPSSHGICQADINMVFSLVGIGSVPLLQLPAAYLGTNFVVTPKELNNDSNCLSSSDAPIQVRLGAILESVRGGRVLLLNMFQMLGFYVFATTSLALGQVIALAVPLSVAPALSPPLIMIFVCFYIPTITISMLFSPAMDLVMKNTPRKTIFEVRPRDRDRFICLLFVRIFIVIFSVFVIGWVAASDALGTHLRPDLLGHFSWLDITNDESLAIYWHVQDVMSFEMLLSIIVQACSMLHRGQKITQFPHFWSHPVFCTSSVALLLFHIGICTVRAYMRVGGFGLYQRLSWILYIVIFLSATAGGFLLPFLLNKHDDSFYRRHLNFLRLEFDTRLGMYSPR
jgi:magnesium-transporting ATPase (P-type)